MEKTKKFFPGPSTAATEQVDTRYMFICKNRSHIFLYSVSQFFRVIAFDQRIKVIVLDILSNNYPE